MTDTLASTYQNDEELKKLYAQERTLQAEIKEKVIDRKRLIAKDLGELVKDVGELVCDHQHKGKYVKTPDPLKGEGFTSLSPGYKEYVCQDCKDTEGVMGKYPDKAYECPDCGVIKGTPRQVRVDTDYRGGTDYHCRVCDKEIAQTTMRIR